MQLSTILDRFSEPETLKMAKLGRELRAKGIDVIDLSLGEPDFDTPQHIKDAAKKAIDDNWSHYTPVPGYLDLREAICTKFKRDNNLDYKPENIVGSDVVLKRGGQVKTIELLKGYSTTLIEQKIKVLSSN